MFDNNDSYPLLAPSTEENAYSLQYPPSCIYDSYGSLPLEYPIDSQKPYSEYMYGVPAYDQSTGTLSIPPSALHHPISPPLTTTAIEGFQPAYQLPYSFFQDAIAPYSPTVYDTPSPSVSSGSSSSYTDLREVSPASMISSAPSSSTLGLDDLSISSPSPSSEDGEGDDAEWRPSSEPHSTRRKHTTTRRARPKPYTSPHKGSGPSRALPQSRNEQFPKDAVSLTFSRRLVTLQDFTCPHCGWEQDNLRLPDFKRHLKTHIRAAADDHYSGYWCKGYRVDEKDGQNLLKGDGSDEVYLFRGERRVGGCMKTFSRKDALKRHLDNANVTCCGQAD